MSLTAEEVRVKLGLRPWAEQAKEHPERRSGRTTRMQCQMIADASEGKRLYLVARTVAYAKHVASYLRRMAHECGVKVDVTIISLTAARRDGYVVRGVDPDAYAYHMDHSIHDAR